MATALSLHPLFRQSVGFDHIHDLFETLTNNEPQKAFPPYDIIKTGENQYQIVMAVAGYGEDDVVITVEKDQLKVSGKIEIAEENEDTVYLHRGIAKRAFERSFQLAENMKVNDASMHNGLLSINLERLVPEEQKPRSIAINGKTPQLEQQ